MFTIWVSTLMARKQVPEKTRKDKTISPFPRVKKNAAISFEYLKKEENEVPP
ncbi:MAG: hypothetical protein R6U68_15505 [Desulfobacteraceae bacterium]